MPKSSTFAIETKKKMGRPLTVDKDDGPATNVGIRLTSKQLAVVDEYAAEFGITRSKAMRDIVNHGIDAWGKLKKRRARGSETHL